MERRQWKSFKQQDIIFDVIFVDHNLSRDVSAGCGVTELLRSLECDDSLVIGLSSNVNKYRSKFLGSGVHDVWSKPLPSLSEFFRQLKQLLSVHVDRGNCWKLLELLALYDNSLNMTGDANLREEKVNEETSVEVERDVFNSLSSGENIIVFAFGSAANGISLAQSNWMKLLNQDAEEKANSGVCVRVVDIPDLCNDVTTLDTVNPLTAQTSSGHASNSITSTDGTSTSRTDDKVRQQRDYDHQLKFARTVSFLRDSLRMNRCIVIGTCDSNGEMEVGNEIEAEEGVYVGEGVDIDVEHDQYVSESKYNEVNLYI